MVRVPGKYGLLIRWLKVQVLYGPPKSLGDSSSIRSDGDKGDKVETAGLSPNLVAQALTCTLCVAPIEDRHLGLDQVRLAGLLLSEALERRQCGAISGLLDHSLRHLVRWPSLTHTTIVTIAPSDRGVRQGQWARPLVSPHAVVGSPLALRACAYR